jgi:hypothetical protein
MRLLPFVVCSAGAYSKAAASMPAITAVKTTATPKRSTGKDKASMLAPTIAPEPRSVGLSEGEPV